MRLPISLVNCSLESDMATRVVLDHSGDSRHVFDRVNAESHSSEPRLFSMN